ncbi:MAG: hypothetical protein ACMUHM_05010 [Thermoplasmatota archaeon]
MPASGDGTDPMVQKLEMILKKGDMIISILEKQGVQTSEIKGRMEEAKNSFSSGELSKAYKLAQQSIGDLMKLKEGSESPTSEASSKRGKGVFALIRDNSDEMNKKIEEWKIITRGWRDKGYSFEEEPSLFNRQFDEIEKRFISIGGQIEKAEVLRGKINRVREDFDHVGRSYKKKIDEIEIATFRLDRLDNIERRLSALVTSLKSIEGRFTTLRNRISRFKRQGLNTSSLEDILENDEDLDYLDKQFNIYESNVEFLLKEKQKLKVFKDDPMLEKFQKKVHDIEKMIDDPWQLDQVVERMLSLEKDLKSEKDSQKRKTEETTRRVEIKKSLEKYSEEGFKTDMISQLLDEDINLLEEEFDIFIRQTARLRSLKEKLFKLDATGFEEEVSSISQKLFDPTSIESVEKEINDLKENILNQKVRSQRIEAAIKEWNGMGFKISKLENAAKKDIAQAEAIYEDYSVKIRELTELEGKLQNIRHKDLDDMIHKVQLKIKNPELIETVRKEMAYILEVVNDMEGLRSKRKELNDLLKVWRGQGYKMDRILHLMKEEDTVKGLENIILQYTRAIASLESFKSNLPAEERGWFPDSETFIRNNMDDPELSDEVLDAFTKLKALNKKEEKRRGEISRKLKELSTRGIDISRVEPLLIGDKQTLDEEYAIFKENVKKLLKIKANLLKEAKLEKNQGKEMFAKSITDPYSIETYEEQIKGSSFRPALPPAKEESKAPSDEIKELKELAKEAYKEDRLDEALRLFEIILSMDPNHKESKFYKKKVLLKLKSPAMEKAEEPLPALPPAKETTDENEAAEEKAVGGGDPNCLSCKGSGKCIWCDGSGKCSTCGGSGKSLGDDCHSCKTTGECNVCKGTGKCSWCNI